MKRSYFFLILFMILFTACSEKNTFLLEGNIEGLSSDTLLIHYIEPFNRLDTLIASKGKIKKIFTVDTLSIFNIILGNQNQIPIIVEKGKKAVVKGDENLFVLKGDGENRLMGEMLYSIIKEDMNHKSTKALIDSLIQAHPRSYTNIYLIDRYYAHESIPDYSHIISLIESLSGNIQDTRYISNLKERVQKMNTGVNQPLSIYNEKGKDGQLIGFNAFKDKYALISFWASWNAESVIDQDSVEIEVKDLKKEKFIALSVSLDMDRNVWMQAISKRDTTNWKQVCDFKGWKGDLVNQAGIIKLPSNVLIDKNRRIIAKDLYGIALVDKVKDLIKQDKEREEQIKKTKKK